MKRALLFLSLLFVPVSVRAQTSTGQIAIAVVDTSGGIVPGATVQVVGSDTRNVVRTLVTDEHGAAVAPLLQPGRYDIEVELAGFQKLVRKGDRPAGQ